jgi:hypothetical protein
MSDKIIESGYYVELTTWENDGDNYKTETHTGLEWSEVLFLNEIYKKFNSGYKSNSFDNTFGNREICDIEQSVIDWFKSLPEYIKNAASQNNEIDDYCILELIEEFVDVWNDGEKYRVVDSIKVWYNPETITMTDVTEVLNND